MATTLELNSPGDRLKRARLLAGIHTRREFAQRHGISANTLQSWEQGKSALTVKGAQRLVAALKKEGWLCSIEWLLEGSSLPPSHFEMSHPFANDTLMQEEERIYKEIQFFKQNNSNAIVLTIHDNAMEPFFFVGDVIGGIQDLSKDIEELLGMLCILELEHNQIIPRCLQAGSSKGTFVAAATNPKTKTAPLNIFDAKIISAAPILWHRKKF